VLDLLDRHGLLVDQRVLRGPGGQAGQPARHVQAAQARAHGDAAERMRQTRAGAAVGVTGFGHLAGDWLAPELGRLLGGAGVGARAGADPGRAAALVGVGEPDRDRLDPWIRAGTAHLLVRLTEGQATVGPFVAPGRTACLRCVDAHCTDADPAWPLLVAQYTSAAARDRADGAPEPLDPLLATLALAWAARDLATFVDGGRPSTWSATVTLDADLATVRCRSWLRHPACGCGWG
jgi:bacteriocin biosynthesis cyclodehydratase domain-containing protein